MRELFAAQLDELEARLQAELQCAARMLATVGEAVLSPAPSSTEVISAAGRGLRQASRRLDSDLVTVTALQAPVAGDLRRVLVMIEVAHVIERIGNQFLLIGEELDGIEADVIDRDGGAGRLSEMAGLASRQLAHAASALAARDVSLARRLDREDDAIDKLNRLVFRASLEAEPSRAERELALRHVLIARSLERIGDNAVDIAEQAVCLVTAEPCEFSDASQPRAAA
jgi:phosphate transport system protein